MIFLNKMEKAKKIYQSIEPPTKLNSVVNTSIEAALKSKHKRFGWLKPLMYSVASICIIFVITLNSSMAFAKSIYDIPIIGDVARVFTFREYSQSNNSYSMNIKVPAIENTKHTDLEKRINQEIQAKIDIIKQNAELRAEEDKKAFLESGGTEEDLPYFTVDVNYEVKSSNENILSFVINHTESYANTYTYQTFYNIDLKSGKEMTLNDILGNNYKEIVAESITKQIKERIKKEPQLMYYVNDGELDEVTLDHLQFYINSLGNVVISFDKGTIAPPPVGIQEFEIIN